MAIPRFIWGGDWEYDNDWDYEDDAEQIPDTVKSDQIKSTRAPGDPDGMNCKSCKEFYPMAEPNQSDGTLICYSCRI